MALRGTNRVQALRLGGAVLVVAAGTLVALVVSEWPEGTGEPVRAAARNSIERVERTAAERPVAVNTAPPRSFLTPDIAADGMMPSLVTAGSAEEARRNSAERRDLLPRHMTGQVPENSQEVEATAGDSLDFAMGDMAWPVAPAARSLNDITLYEPTRTVATLQLLPGLEVTGGKTGFGSGDRPGIGSIENADGSEARGEAELYDFSARLNALAGVPQERPFELGVIGGLRSASLFDPALRDTKMTDPVPVFGGDARLKWTERSMLRASAVGEAPGTARDYMDLRLEQVWRIGGDTSLSVGWRHLRGILSNDQPQPTVRQDAILLELKIGF